MVSDYDLDLEAYDLDIAEQVREVMATLSEGERRAIELAYFGGHTYREVARILERTRRHHQEPDTYRADAACARSCSTGESTGHGS